jgi:hypothetical protein
MRLFLLVPASVLALSLTGCSQNPSPNTSQQQGYPQQQGYYQQQPGAYPQQPGAYPQQPGAYPQQPGAYPQQPGTYQQPPAQTATPAQTTPAGSGGTAATPIDPSAAAAGQPALNAMAASECPGMKPDGNAFAGQFQEGQTLEQPFTLQAGKCYSVVAVGGGITELHIQIVAQPAPMLPPTVLAQDNAAASPNVTLGGKGNCFKNPLPLGGAAKVLIKATKGSGVALAQIYVK